MKSDTQPINNLIDLYRNTISKEDKKWSDKNEIILPSNVKIDLDYDINDIFNNEAYSHGVCTIRPGDVVVDIGANIGLFSRYAASKKAKKIYAFEPHEDNFKCVEKNKPPICEVFNIAIADKDGEIDFYIDSYSGGHSLYEDNNINDSRTGNKKRVKCRSLNSLLEDGTIPHIDFLKVDTEGAEYEIFKGLSDDNLEKIDRIAMEFHISTLRGKFTVDNLKKRLKKWFSSYVVTFTGDELCMVYFWKENINITYHFHDGGFLKIKESEHDKKYDIKFIDQDNDKLIYETSITTNCWAQTARKWFTNWKIELSYNNHVIFEHNMDLKNKRVVVYFDSNSLGDTIAWIPYVEEFRKKHNCHVICCTFWNYLFKKGYPELNFISPSEPYHNIYAIYNVGLFEPFDVNNNPIDYRTISLQQIATDILGIDYKEIKPKIDIPYTHSFKRNKKNKYVCIAIHSTCQCKYWNYINGWDEVVKYLNDKGYVVKHISKEKGVYMGNYPPDGVEDCTGLSIKDTIVLLKDCEFFIGISSGLSWLAWAVGIPTILISGFTAPWFEPVGGIERIHNPEVCNGCFNDSDIVFDKGDWNWCPRGKDFECSKSITPEMVKKSIDRIIKREER